MAKVTQDSKLAFSFKLELNEEEARALDAIVGYGTDSFLKVFYEHLGEHYLKPYEKGCRTLFYTIASEIREQLSKANEVRSLLNEAKEKTKK